MNKQIKTEIVINASKEKVWAILTNFSHYPQWNPFIVSIEGELVKGKKLKNTLRNGSKNMVFKPTLLSVVPYRYFDWLGSLFVKGLFDGHHYFEIEELTHNQVKLTHGETFSGLLSSTILKKIGEDTRTNFIRMNQAVKTLAEQP
ncbi:MAG: SRPBCC domain-containing protein [Chitinophagaceae bacterium]|nr:MAG: SRPBCC domain-containing protein [Chitinophagaceae bacterium]